ncbi:MULTISPECIES: carboxypeptidase-like regulatory domain-containing protein [unclassified Pseudonocardia]|uniref:carboxypeptidase-like regulatory domain-containing protein n=1 Tax=unclassified Pseudonocardia TaxID=2619320 RepID=UPI00094AED72|nr:carboxypeptidase-like regulatory domain-containing protein [Pseudonocardia sp. Ae707_Ps1]OLM16191.1 hypothetical protein Ae707Ps1_0449 [Pseudonocardia sp. Ae707_Ps1]
MSTWALLGLLVVVLVAVGIAAFLRWGRNRDEHPTSGDGSPPRTVADLVDRRARGLDDGRGAGTDDLPSGGEDAPHRTENPYAAAHPDAPDMVDTGSDVAQTYPETAGPDADDTRAGTASDDTAAVPAVHAVPALPGGAAADRPLRTRDDDLDRDAHEDLDEDAGDDPDDPDDPAATTPIGPTHSSAPDITRVPEGEDRTDRIPEVRPAEPRVTPDVSAGPVGPPWARGFKDGKPVEPVEPAPVRRFPRPSPTARPRPAAAPDAGAANHGPDSSAPDISTPPGGNETAGSGADDATTGLRAVTALGAGAAAASIPFLAKGGRGTGDAGSSPTGTDADTPDTGPPAAEAGSTDATDAGTTAADAAGADVTGVGDTDVTDADATGSVDGASGADTAEAPGPEVADAEPEVDEIAATHDPAPATPAEQIDFGRGAEATGAAATGAVVAGAAATRSDSRSPVDPDLVRRVTTVPADRSVARSTASPDTEREFREARDRITGQYGWTGRVPEQQGGPGQDRTSGRSAPIGLVPGGSVAQESGEHAEPPPRPAPRLMRSVRPAPPPAPDTVRTDAAQDPEPEASVPVNPAAPTTAEPTTAAGGEPPARTSAPEPPTVRAEEVALTVQRSGPEPAAVVPGTAPQDVEVRVLGHDDAALAGATVAVRDRAGGPVGTAVTGDDGVARIAVPGAGSFVVVAAVDGYRPGVAACAVGDTAAGATLRLRRAAVVHGTARTTDGAPAAGVDVVLTQDGEPVAEARTGSDGAFRLADLDAGRYRLAAGSASGVDVEVEAGADVAQDVTGS